MLTQKWLTRKTFDVSKRWTLTTENSYLLAVYRPNRLSNQITIAMKKERPSYGSTASKFNFPSDHTKFNHVVQNIGVSGLADVWDFSNDHSEIILCSLPRRIRVVKLTALKSSKQTNMALEENNTHSKYFWQIS